MGKHILIISAVFPPDQVTSALLNYDLAKSLSKEYKVIVLRPHPTRPIGFDFSKDWNDPDFETITINSYTHPHSDFAGRMRESISFGLECSSYIKQHYNEIDFIYNDCWQYFGLYIVAKTAHKYNIPYIVPIQDIYPEGPFVERKIPHIIKKVIIDLLMPIDKYYQKHAAAIRTITPEMRDYLSETRKISPDKYLVVNNWQNDEDFVGLPKRAQKNKEFVFAYVGSINVHANVELMIKAFAEANIPNSFFKIYGGGNKKDNCLKLVEELGLTNVTFGFVSRTDIPVVQADADVLVLALPSGNGKLAMPSKLTSYMLSGRPVLASVDLDSAACRIIKENNCGIVVEPDNLRSLAIAFRKMSQETKEEMEQMGINSRNYAFRELTRERNLKTVISRINKIIE